MERKATLGWDLGTDPTRGRPAVDDVSPLSDLLLDGVGIETMFQLILDRAVGNEIFKAEHGKKHSLSYWVRRLIESEEFTHLFCARLGVTPRSDAFIADEDFRTPRLAHASHPSNIIVTGSCMTNVWKAHIEQAFPSTEVLHQVFNNASELEDIETARLRDFAFQIVQIPLRGVLNEREYLGLSYTDDGRTQLEKALKDCVFQIRRHLDSALKYNRQCGLPSFILNFPVPQANPLGMLIAKYDITNLAHFVRELNKALYEMVAQEKAAYVIDYDEIVAALGKRYIQDDITSHLNHGAFIFETHTDLDIHLTPAGFLDAIYQRKPREAALAVFNECVAAYTIISPADKIKLVVFDLDGTFWRGVAAECDVVDGHLTEGWPLSILEAAAFLKARGVLLAIASKNDPAVAGAIWQNLYGSHFPLSNFASVKIGWGHKADSIAEVLKETNILPGNCLFVDDNPLERARVKIAFPEIKLLEGPIYTWRRQLLWAAELQTASISGESVTRTESIKSMIAREQTRETMNEEEYFRQLDVRVDITSISERSHPKFGRALELINKTNQFNTTGRRWLEAEIEGLLIDGGCLMTADVSDRHSHYGLTAVLIANANTCVQMVMSCRVFGLRVEFDLLNAFLQKSDKAKVLKFRDTGKNALCRRFLDKLGLLAPREQTLDADYDVSIPSDHTVAVELLSSCEAV